MIMKNIKTAFVIGCIVAFTVGFVIVVELNMYGGFVSKSTEQKYLRNIEKFYPIGEDQVSIHYRYRDSLTFMARNRFGHWYISKVGLIKNRSLLAHKLDSICKYYNSKFK